jgi:hypothetical protein
VSRAASISGPFGYKLPQLKLERVQELLTKALSSGAKFSYNSNLEVILNKITKEKKKRRRRKKDYWEFRNIVP